MCSTGRGTYLTITTFTAEKGKCVLLVGALTPTITTLKLKKANAFYWCVLLVGALTPPSLH